MELHEDAVVGPAQAFDRRGAFVGSVEGDGALEGVNADVVSAEDDETNNVIDLLFDFVSRNLE